MGAYSLPDKTIDREVQATLWRRGLVSILGLGLFVLAYSTTLRQPGFLKVFVILVLGSLADTIWVLSRPQIVRVRYYLYISQLLSLAQAAAVVHYSGDLRSPFVLLYPVIMVTSVAVQPAMIDMIAVGVIGFVLFVGGIYVSYGSWSFLHGRLFLVEAGLLWGVMVNVVVVTRVIGGKNLKLERSRRALEKFASGLKTSNEKLERLSFTDGVTGVYNYRYFQLRLREELSRARRCKGPVSLLMVDVDGFKRFNDTYGHPQGDVVLQHVVAALKENVRDFDAVARYGGDEFAVILADADAETAMGIANRIRAAVEANGVLEGMSQGVTVSLGIAVYPKNAENAEELIRRADDALYRVKLSRRNSVQLYSSVMDDLKVDVGAAESPALLNTLQTLITVINARDRYTYGHSERVVKYALAIAQRLEFSADDLRTLKYAAFLHDIGKIEISRDILNKKGPLSAEERSIIKQHTIFGVNIIEPVRSLESVLNTVLHHHERFDGRGYPAGLAGKDIPLMARVLALADSFDAMMSNRPYRDALSLEQAVDEIEQGRGTQFDPDVVDAFKAAVKDVEASMQVSPLNAQGKMLGSSGEWYCGRGKDGQAEDRSN